jgi:hypothetical protein
MYRSLHNEDRDRIALAVHALIGDEILTVPGFVKSEKGVTVSGGVAGLLIPVRELDGRIIAIKIRQTRVPKYLYLSSRPRGASPGSPVHVPLGTPKITSVIRITEGELKADICSALDVTPTLSVPGVTQWRTAIPVISSMQAGTIVLAFDAPDLRSKPPVLKQLESFWRELRDNGLNVEVEDWL